MFKTASTNQQSRSVRTVVESRANSGGIDHTVFKNTELFDKLQDEKVSCIEEKRRLELLISDVKYKLSNASSVKHFTGNHVDRTTWQQWNRKKVDLGNKVRDLDAKIAEVNAQIAKINQIRDLRDRKSFEAMFFVMAKTLLAGPVYERLIAATIHRMGENCNEVIENVTRND